MIAGLAGKLNLGFLSSIGQQDRYVAFDIGSSSVKMVEAAVDKNGYHLLNVGILSLPPGAVQNNMVVEGRSVAEAIRTLIQQHGVRSNNVISAVPGRAVIIKKIQMPRQEPDELEANVEFEANKLIPENLENVNLDYQVLGYLEGGNKMEVLLVAVKKEIVNSFADAIAAAGLTPAIMDVDYFAMESMFETNYEPQTTGEAIGLIHIGAHYTSINVVSNGISTFTGDLPVGGAEFTDTLRRAMEISDEEAETLKVSAQLNGNNGTDVEGLLRSAARSFAEEIQRTLSLYGAIASEEGIRNIYLTGGGAKVAGLISVMEERLGVPVQLAEPFRNFRVSKNLEKASLAEMAPLLGLAVGLAVRRPGDK